MHHTKRVMLANIYRCAKGDDYRGIPADLVDEIRTAFMGERFGLPARIVCQRESEIMDIVKRHPRIQDLVDNA